jgi:hypothetical protein
MTLHDEISREIVAGSARVVPLIGIAGASFLGMDLQSWVLIATLVGGVLQIGYVGWKWLRDWRRERNAKA